MTDQAHRAAELDRLLKRALEQGADAPAEPCPAPEVLAAYVEGGLEPAERTGFEAHAASCRRCLETLAVLAKLEPLPAQETTPAAERSWWRSLWPWVAPLAAAATAAVVYVAVRPVATPSSPPALPDVEMAQQAARERLGEQDASPVSPQVGQSTEQPAAGPAQSANTLVQKTETGSGPRAPSTAQARPREDGLSSRGQFASSPMAEVPPSAPPEPSRAAHRQSSATADQPTANAASQPSSPIPPSPADAGQDRAVSPGAPAAEGKLAAATPGGGDAAMPVAGAARPVESPALQEKAEPVRKSAPAAAAPMAAQPERRDARERAEADAPATSAKSVGFASAAMPRWRVGARGRIERSDDGGATWRSQASGVTTDLSAFQVVNATTVWAVGARGTVLVCVDGDAWHQANAPTPDDLVRVVARDAKTAVVTARDGTRYSTDDRGVTWTTVR